MGQAFYRQYRPKKLSEVVGQEHITDTLSNALKQGKISHAYLFTGPRGTGKTSIARILAHEVNDLPYTDESSHLDIIEIDAASNRRIDEIRDIREKVHISPTSAKYKVYIIDEVHMLTKEAFNALLKTLEEPPKHVIFMLATTEVHKLPETIISRTQRYSLKPVDYDKVVAHLKSIADKEKLSVDKDALRLIAEHGEGSFRDSISLLDQAAGFKGSITLDTILELLGTPPKETIAKLLAALQAGDYSGLLSMLDQMRDQGLSAGSIAKELVRSLRTSLIAGKPLFDPSTHASLTRNLIEVGASAHPFAALEVALIEALPSTAQVLHTLDYIPQAPRRPENEKIRKLENKIDPEEKEAVKSGTPSERPIEEEAEPPKEETKPAPEKPAETRVEEKPKSKPKKNEGGSFSDEQWQLLLQAVKKDHNTLYTVLRMAKPSIEGDQFVLSCSFSFHQKQLNIPKNRKVIGDFVEQITGVGYELIVRAADKDEPIEPVSVTIPAPDKAPSPNMPPPDLPTSSAVDNSLDVVKDIFGGGEILS